MVLLVVCGVIFLGLLTLPVLTALPFLEEQRRQAEEEDPLGEEHRRLVHSSRR